jgi:hypothetical protein
MVVSGAGQAGAWKAIVRHDDIGVMRSFRANIALACSLDGSRRFDLGAGTYRQAQQFRESLIS